MLSPGPHYAEGEIQRGGDEEEDGLKYKTEVETSDPSYTTPPSTGGHSKPSPHPLCSPSPEDSDLETSAVLQTAEIKAQVKAFLAEVDEDLKLEDLLPLENVTPVPIHIPTILGFVPFAMSTGQQCVPSKGLPRAYHPYKGSIG